MLLCNTFWCAILSFFVDLVILHLRQLNPAAEHTISYLVEHQEINHTFADCCCIYIHTIVVTPVSGSCIILVCSADSAL